MAELKSSKRAFSPKTPLLDVRHAKSFAMYSLGPQHLQALHHRRGDERSAGAASVPRTSSKLALRYSQGAPSRPFARAICTAKRWNSDRRKRRCTISAERPDRQSQAARPSKNGSASKRPFVKLFRVLLWSTCAAQHSFLTWLR